mmetsp:Transcript_52317/g.114066  ORF Transcript_52317/g.114066 Transcript_52317/m.114066 type:complete len:393 (+) Transcript_52317:790-1968(+)
MGAADEAEGGDHLAQDVVVLVLVALATIRAVQHQSWSSQTARLSGTSHPMLGLRDHVGRHQRVGTSAVLLVDQVEGLAVRGHVDSCSGLGGAVPSEALPNSDAVGLVEAADVVEVEVSLIGDQVLPSLATIRRLPELGGVGAVGGGRINLLHTKLQLRRQSAVGAVLLVVDDSDSVGQSGNLATIPPRVVRLPARPGAGSEEDDVLAGCSRVAAGALVLQRNFLAVVEEAARGGEADAVGRRDRHLSGLELDVLRDQRGPQGLLEVVAVQGEQRRPQEPRSGDPGEGACHGRNAHGQNLDSRRVHLLPGGSSILGSHDDGLRGAVGVGGPAGLVILESDSNGDSREGIVNDSPFRRRRGRGAGDSSGSQDGRSDDAGHVLSASSRLKLGTLL